MDLSMAESDKITFWAKTTADNRPGISVHDHCVNVGCVAETILAGLPGNVRSLLPPGTATLAALHDVGKITIGFQAKCPAWLASANKPPCSDGEIALSVTDHALVSQHFLQQLPTFSGSRLWAVAVGSHHGRFKGKKISPDRALEAIAGWAHDHRTQLLAELVSTFGPLPATAPDKSLSNSDLWLLAGLITVADWIGSNETWFSPENGLPPAAAHHQAIAALHQIGWPGGKLRLTEFSAAFANRAGVVFDPNPLQQAVAEAARTPGVIIVEGPMGCGKTEAALFAAQQLIAAGHQHGIYFALPTQVTSNRIHERIERFLRATLADTAAFRLAHGNAWLQDDFDLRINPAFPRGEEKDGEQPNDTPREARSWFASAKQALLAPYGVGTVDQALQGVVAVKHFFVRRFALAGKVVILDEVHSYDIYTGTLITALIRELVNLRCSVIILSATLTADRRKELLAAGGIKKMVSPTEYPLVSFGETGGECRHLEPAWSAHKKIALRSAIISEAETISELTRRAEAGQHVLWIRNTVVEAQQAYRAAVSAICQDSVCVGLLHSRFPFARREKLESYWLEYLGPNRPTAGPGSILIATQVVEQSVDIDLDFIVSDLAPTDMLLQRLGRLWRHSRPHRQAATPEFWIRLPDLTAAENTAALKAALGRSGWVYAPYVLLRTAAVWQSRLEITLPADIRPLLEATYAAADPQEPAAWQDLHAELEKDKRQLAANAEAATLVLGRPMLQDEDAILTRRQGAPTTPVILLRSITTIGNNSVRVVALDGSQAEISAYDWRRSSAKFLQQWLVRTPRWLVPAEAPHPPWLTLHGPNQATVATVADDGRCLFADQLSTLTYDPRLGLFVERIARVNTTPKDDDEFDY
jgi:CRISPR-associated endonuclease/helicase Cas3